MFLTTRALVLREARYKEADKILTVLTESDGKLTVKARGALRRGCGFGSAAQHLCYGEMTLFGNRGRWQLNEASVIEPFLGLRDRLSALALGAYISELLEAAADSDSPNAELLSLGLNALYALSRSMYSDRHIKAAFEFKLMCIAGFEPSLESCASCGSTEPLPPTLDVSNGCLICAACRDANHAAKLAPLCEGSLSAMRFVAGAPLNRAFAFTLAEDAAENFKLAAESYLLAQLERGFRTLDYYNRLT